MGSRVRVTQAAPKNPNKQNRLRWVRPRKLNWAWFTNKEIRSLSMGLAFFGFSDYGVLAEQAPIMKYGLELLRIPHTVDVAHDRSINIIPLRF
jgi:hypothetical protein